MTSPTNATVPPLPDAPAEDTPRYHPEKSIEQLMAEQAIAGPQDLDALTGAGVDLWESDAEFERFQEWLRESRRERR